MNRSRTILPQLPDTFVLRAASTLLLAALVVVAAVGGTFRPFEHRLNELTFAALERPASGQIHLVEMDAASMAAIQTWPWRRGHYARLVEQLDAAGVRSISFDVDFSGSSADPADDRAFGAAIAAAQAPVTLPTFNQNAGFRDGRQLDSLPVAPLREHAHLASVSVIPDEDGFVRRMPLGTVTNAVPRPSIAAYVAGRPGEVEKSFPIDFAIDMTTIPRHSFIAVERGEFDAQSLRGKDVIIGATAIELGDRYPAPRYGVIPGVILQALAAETLVRSVPIYGSWPAPLLLAALLAAAIMAAAQRGTVGLRWGGASAAIVLISIGARLLADTWFEIVPALALLALVAGVRAALLTHYRAERKRRIDAESGLPNLLALDTRRDASAGAKAGAGADRYLIAAQIDDFDSLKLAMGAGNLGELLRRLSERLQVAGSAAAMYRTDDRTLVWHTPLTISEVEQQLAGLRALMRSPFEVGGRRLGVSLTYGVAAADAHTSASSAASSAAHAASVAKRAGKPWRLHTDGEGETAAQQFSLLGELDEAVRSGQIKVLYQPKLNLATGQIDAAEALVRWQHPVYGMLPPDCFIPLIEEAGRIDGLTLAVLSQAISDARCWLDRGQEIAVAVNISAGLLTSDSFAARALAMVKNAGVPARMLTFEVTESAQFDDADKAIAILESFRAAGVQLSIDDYGTGQSTLNYLKLLPVTELKIDRSFVQHSHLDRGDAMLVRSTVQLAHELGIKVVAEGIEDAACLAFIRDIGCDYGQGYCIGRPLPADELAALACQPLDLAA